MKCPEQFNILQHNIRIPIRDEDFNIKGEYHLLKENQSFGMCYEEQCAAWDKENKRCKKNSS